FGNVPPPAAAFLRLSAARPVYGVNVADVDSRGRPVDGRGERACPVATRGPRRVRRTPRAVPEPPVSLPDPAHREHGRRRGLVPGNVAQSDHAHPSLRRAPALRAVALHRGATPGARLLEAGGP